MRPLRLLMLLCVVPCGALAQPKQQALTQSRTAYFEGGAPIPHRWLGGFDPRYPLARFEVVATSDHSSYVTVRVEALQQVTTAEGFIAWLRPQMPYGVMAVDADGLAILGGGELIEPYSPRQTVKLSQRAPPRLPQSSPFSNWVKASRFRMPRPLIANFVWCDGPVSFRSSLAEEAKTVSLSHAFFVMGDETPGQRWVPAIFSGGYLVHIGGFLLFDAATCRPASRREIKRDWSTCGGTSEEVENEVCPQPEPLPPQPRTQ